MSSPTKSLSAISMPRLAARAGVGGAGSIRTLRSRPGNASITAGSIGSGDPLSTRITS